MNKEEKDKAFNWRWDKLCEEPEKHTKPSGICEIIDNFIWGNLSWEQRALIDNTKILKEALKSERDLICRNA